MGVEYFVNKLTEYSGEGLTKVYCWEKCDSYLLTTLFATCLHEPALSRLNRVKFTESA